MFFLFLNELIDLGNNVKVLFIDGIVFYMLEFRWIYILGYILGYILLF